MRKSERIKKEDFYKALKRKNSEQLEEMIRGGALEEMDNEELKEVFLKMMALRNRPLIDLLAKRSHYFPMEMLDVEIKNHADKDFVSYVLDRYGKKFPYKKQENANRLFEVACAADCRPMLLFLLGKGLAEGQYPRLIGGSEALLEVLGEVKVSALHPDTVVTFFVEAAITDPAGERIRELIDLGFDITTLNSEGLDAAEVLERGIQNYNYGKDKKGKAEKQKDEQGLKTLTRLLS